MFFKKNKKRIKSHMKILIIIDETNFYHPSFFLDLYKRLKKRKYNVCVGLVTKVKKKIR